jgi:hypothetical protein
MDKSQNILVNEKKNKGLYLSGLFSIYKALGSILSTAKKKKERERKRKMNFVGRSGVYQ